MVIIFAPSASVREELKEPSGATDTGAPFTVTAEIPLPSLAEPLTVTELTATTSWSSGREMSSVGGVVSGAGGGEYVTVRVTVAVFRFGLLSVATTVIVFAPSASVREELKAPPGETETVLPFTVTERIPLASVAVPLTVIVLTSTICPASGCETIRVGGVVSGAGGGV
jgi:hypothetical protein